MTPRTLSLIISAIVTCNGCATQTPIAVSTPQYKVPPNPAELQQREEAAQVKTKAALNDWSKYLADLPTPSGTQTQP